MDLRETEVVVTEDEVLVWPLDHYACFTGRVGAAVALGGAGTEIVFDHVLLE